MIITVTDSVGHPGQGDRHGPAGADLQYPDRSPRPSSACGANTICSGQTATAAVTGHRTWRRRHPGSSGALRRRQRCFRHPEQRPGEPAGRHADGGVRPVWHARTVIIEANVSAPTQPAPAARHRTHDRRAADCRSSRSSRRSMARRALGRTVDRHDHWPRYATCSAGFRVDYYIYGGTPPYTVVSSTFPQRGEPAQYRRSLVEGGAFTAITNGTCVNPLVFTIRRRGRPADDGDPDQLTRGPERHTDARRRRYVAVCPQARRSSPAPARPSRIVITRWHPAVRHSSGLPVDVVTAGRSTKSGGIPGTCPFSGMTGQPTRRPLFVVTDSGTPQH